MSRSSSLGSSGYGRLARDSYPTPIENVAALVLGLQREEIALPAVVLDPCAGDGAVATALKTLAPNVTARLSDLHPDEHFAAEAGYLGSEPVDAGDPDSLRRAVQAAGARGVVSNPPYRMATERRIVRACLGLLREGSLDLVALLHLATHLTTAEGYATTMLEPTFALSISCAWRTVLFGDGSVRGKQSHVWRVWTRETDRKPDDPYDMLVVSRAEADTLLKGPRSPAHPEIIAGISGAIGEATANPTPQLKSAT